MLGRSRGYDSQTCRRSDNGKQSQKLRRLRNTERQLRGGAHFGPEIKSVLIGLSCEDGPQRIRGKCEAVAKRQRRHVRWCLFQCM